MSPLGEFGVCSAPHIPRTSVVTPRTVINFISEAPHRWRGGHEEGKLTRRQLSFPSEPSRGETFQNSVETCQPHAPCLAETPVVSRKTCNFADTQTR